MLSVHDLHAGYGPIKALRGIDLTVGQGEIVSLIGSNGAGKTTLLMTICGIVKPTGGTVRFDGRDVTGVRSYDIMRRGVAQVPEGRRIFPRMTVMENLLIGVTHKNKGHLRDDLERTLDAFPILKERSHQSGGTLSGGEQQMLAIGRAIMSRPRLLLMDEPSLGLAPILVKQIFQIIRDINKRGTTILLVEQNAYAALNLAHRGYVLATGEIVMSGPAQELLENPDVKNAYLGG